MRLTSLAFATLTIAFFVTDSNAAVAVFDGSASVDYFDAANWSTNTVPGINDRVDIAGGLSVTATHPNPLSFASSARNFYLGGESDSGDGTDFFGAHPAPTSGDGTLNLTNGFLSIQNDFYLGRTADTTGTANLFGSAHANASRIKIGDSGIGTVNLFDSTLIQPSYTLSLGTSATGIGNVNQHDSSQAFAGTLIVGDQGTGTWTQDGPSTWLQASFLMLANEPNSQGTFNLASGFARADIKIGVGANSKGVLNQTGGTLGSSGDSRSVVVGVNNGTDVPAEYNLSGGTLGETLIVGTATSGFGKVAISGTSAVTNPGISIEYGEVIQSGGTVNIGSLQMADVFALSSSSASYMLSGGTLTVDQGIIGGSGAASMTISGGSFVSNFGPIKMKTGPNAYLGPAANITQTGGSVSVPMYWIAIGDMGPAAYNISGGSLSAGSINVGDFHGQGELNISGTAEVNGLMVGSPGIWVGKWSSSGEVNQTGGTVNQNLGRFHVGGANDPFEGDPSQYSGTYNLQDGTVNLGFYGLAIGEFGSRGNFNLQGGTLNGNGYNIWGGELAVFNFTGGLMKNVGNFDLPLTQQGGILAPGASPGTMNIDGGYTLESLGTLQMEVNGHISGTLYDVLNVTGLVTLNGSLQFALGYAPNLGDSFAVLQNDGTDEILGSYFASLPEGATFYSSYDATNYRFQITYFGNDGNDVVITNVQVPEPSAACLWVVGLTAMAFICRQGKQDRAGLYA